MSNSQPTPGIFLLSFDTELAWGYHDCFRPELFSPDGSRERRAVDGILDLLDEFGIIATWAFVGHVLYERCEACEICPILDWRDRYPTFHSVYENNHPLWYGPDLLEKIRARKLVHEIAFHGYTHRTFNESTMPAEDAQIEIQEWLRVAARHQITPRTVIFPRNQIGHLDLFQQAGFTCYRGEETVPAYFQTPLVGRVLRALYYYISAVTQPPLYTPQIDKRGMVNLPSSRWIFGINRHLDRMLDTFNLSTLRLRSMAKGIRTAAQQAKIIHLWAHPFEFRTTKDLDKLRYLLSHVADEVAAGKMRTLSMVDLSNEVLGQSSSADMAEPPSGRHTQTQG